MKEFIEISKGHFVRQHDGREPNATLASILLPTADDPNTIRFFEQWVAKEDYDLHAKPNENLQVFFESTGPFFEGAPKLIEVPMVHFSK